MRCSEAAIAEPLAGTAPAARWWWLIEVPGAWGRNAVADCRVAPVRELSSNAERRVILVRRPGRHPAEDPDAPLRVWIAGAVPGDPDTRLAVAQRPEDMLTWPVEGPSSATPDPGAPVLAVCTNGSRDLCCGLDGRALVDALADLPGVWECSHLGGHRFAPTALHVPTGLVYGRLPAVAARTLVKHGPDPDTSVWLRGRSALGPAAQVAEAHLVGQGLRPDIRDVSVDVSDAGSVVTFGGTPAVRVRRSDAAPRPASCGAVAEVAASWQVVGAD